MLLVVTSLDVHILALPQVESQCEGTSNDDFRLVCLFVCKYNSGIDGSIILS